jgi:cytochrome P450
MSEMITDRQAATKAIRHDLFSSLLDANNDDDAQLSESELIGKISAIESVSQY